MCSGRFVLVCGGFRQIPEYHRQSIVGGWCLLDELREERKR